MRIKTTKGQRTKLLQCHSGIGFIAYKSAHNETCEVGFYTDPKGTLRYPRNGAPLRLEFLDDDDYVQVTPPLGLVPDEFSQAFDCLAEAMSEHPIGSQEASDCYNRVAALLKTGLERIAT